MATCVLTWADRPAALAPSCLLVLFLILADSERLSGEVKLGPQEWALLSVASIDSSSLQEQHLTDPPDNDQSKGVDLRLYVDKYSQMDSIGLEAFLTMEHIWPSEGYGSAGPHACSTLKELCKRCDQPGLSCKRVEFRRVEDNGPLHGTHMWHEQFSVNSSGERYTGFLVVSTCGCTFTSSPVHRKAVALHWQAVFIGDQNISGDMSWVPECVIVASVLAFWVAKQNLNQHTGLQLTALVDAAGNVLDFCYLATIVLSGQPILIVVKLGMFMDSIAYAMLCSFCLLLLIPVFVPDLAGLGTPIMFFSTLIFFIPAVYDQPWNFGAVPLYAQRLRVDGPGINWAFCTMWVLSAALTLPTFNRGTCFELSLWAAMVLAFVGRHVPRLVCASVPIGRRPLIGAAVRLALMGGTYGLLLARVWNEQHHEMGRPSSGAARNAKKLNFMLFGRSKGVRLRSSAWRIWNLCLLLGALGLAISGFIRVNSHEPTAVLEPLQISDVMEQDVAAKEVRGDQRPLDKSDDKAPESVVLPQELPVSKSSDFSNEIPNAQTAVQPVEIPPMQATESTTLSFGDENLDEDKTVATPLAAVSQSLDQNVRVCFCSDEKDLRPLAAAITSALQRSRDPSRIFFHVVTSPEREPALKQQLTRALPNAQITTHANATLQGHIKALIAFRESSGSRKALQSPLNFAPFYLDVYLGVSSGRLVYLDTDVILQGDVIDLHEVDLNGKPVGTVKDCSQRFQTYFNIKELKKLGMKTASKNTCVFNRGVFVVDVAVWRQLHLTQEIERWMNLYKHTEKDLYKFGMSQPPWLLAVQGRYQPIGPEWNCRGLGREFMADGERLELQKQGLNDSELEKLGVKKVGTHRRPFVSQCSMQASLLHFNGPQKPWQGIKRPTDPETKSILGVNVTLLSPKASLCALPEGHVKPSGYKSAGAMTFIECSRLWWEQLPFNVESELLSETTEVT